MPRIFKGVSILVHAIVIGTISYVQIFDPGLLPSPSSALVAYQMPIEINRNIPLPPPPPRAPGPLQNDQRSLAPIAEPNRLPDPGDEPATVSREPGVQGGIEGAGSGGTPFGTIDNPAPPPPPPPPPPPTRPVPLGGNIRPPVKVFNVEPVYPDLARAARKEGIVILEVVIAIDGHVESVRVLRGVPTLDQAAVAAVRQWRFEPARLNDQVVPVVMTVTVNFQLSK